MMVTDLRHFLGIADEAPGPARKLAQYLGFVVRAATAADAGTPWISALTCRRRPGNRPCPGHVVVFRTVLPAPIEWHCSACSDEGVISGWEDSLFDLRHPRTRSDREPRYEVIVNDGTAAALRELQLFDSECERLVFQMRYSSDRIVLTATADELDELVGFAAAEANHETNRRRQKRLDSAADALSDALKNVETDSSSSPVMAMGVQIGDDRRHLADLTGRWRILQMDLWDRDALDLVGPAFIEFRPDHTGSFGLIAVRGWIDWRYATEGPSRVEFSWEGTDDGDQVSGRGWAARQDDVLVDGHIYFHLGDDSSFLAAPNGD